MKIAILGMGVVGKGAYENALAAGGIEVCRVLARHEIEGYEQLSHIITSNIADISGDPDIELVAECMGGVHPAREYVLECIKAGKHIVTPNKNLISACYAELHEAARKYGAELRFTAAAGGGIPWLFNLMRTKRCDSIKEVSGIINGTCNFILNEMSDSGADFETALARAQKLGYAEADPGSDIEGTDTLRKTVISANTAFDCCITEDDVTCMGIDAIRADDMDYLKSMGKVPRLMMHAAVLGNKISAYVEPAAFSENSIQASVKSCNNLITLRAEKLGIQSYYGEGAGMMPSGQSVVQDIIDIRDGVKLTPASGTSCVRRNLKADNDLIRQNYYLRCDEMSDDISEVIDTCEKKGDISYCITKPLTPKVMHELVRSAAAEGRGVFAAAIAE